MKNISLIRAFQKVGITPILTGRKYLARGETHSSTWYIDGSGGAHSLHVNKNGDISAIEIDYFPGFYADTIKEAVEYTTGVL